MEENKIYVRRIFTAVNRIDGIYYKVAKKMKINANTLALLYALNDGNVHSQKQICDEWLIPKTTINTVVRECMEAGYLELPAMPHSKQKMIRLTESGSAYAARLMEKMKQSEDAAMARTLRIATPDFIEGIERFAAILCEEFDKRIL